jgi:uncharacterized membrane protein YeiB
MTVPSISVAPAAPVARIHAMVVLRGVALCGILTINIQHLSMIVQAGFNPAAYGELTVLNRWVWMLSAGLNTKEVCS